MNRPIRSLQLKTLLFALILCVGLGSSAFAVPQNGNGADGRRVVGDPDEMVTLGFKDVGVDETVEWIAFMTGKVVMPLNANILKTKKITLFNDEPLPRTEALDLLIRAFNHNGVGVIEKEDVIIIDQIENIAQHGDLPVITADEDISTSRKKGTMVVKIFRLENAPAAGVGERIEETKPSSAQLSIDENSNQIVLMSNIGYAQHVQQIIEQLDRTYIKVKTQTFRLAHADASEIQENILDLFLEDGASGGSSTNRNRNTNTRARGRTQQAQPSPTTGPGPTAELRVTVNVLQNSVTVQADPAVMEDISELIEGEWDLPRPTGTSKVYHLENTDPIKMRDTLQEVLGQGSGGGAARGARGGAGAQAASVTDLVGNIYQIEAFPDAGTLVVLAKTQESFEFLDDLIRDLDQPSYVGLPEVIELKHANAVELADELNALLSEAGSGATITRPGEGLGGANVGGEEGGGAVGGRETDTAGDIQFPWQRGRQRDDQSPESALIGKVRIVPIVRQNALAILAPISYRKAMRELILNFDRPGRQVMIVAVIAEVELNDDLALGLRVSSADIPLQAIDNAIGGNFNGTGTNEGFLGNLFDSSVLDVGFSANVVLQALAQKTNVRILQEPAVFTADNQEAVFFDGQDVPFITDSNTTDQGGITQSFDYRQVGVLLNVRPRITAQRAVDMEVNLELSNIVPGQTLFGGFIIDRRETTTQVIVKNGQTIVLSGILRDQVSSIERKVPGLGDIPLLGQLFKSRENTKTTTELVAFITPIVVDNPSDNDNNFNEEFRQRLREMGEEIDMKEERLRVRENIVNPDRKKRWTEHHGPDTTEDPDSQDPEQP